MLFKRKSAMVAAATVERAVPAAEPKAPPAKPAAQPATEPGGELDVRSLGRALWRRKRAIILPAVIVAILTGVAVEVATPKYKSSATILYEGRENVFLRADVNRTTGDPGLADDAALASQVQLILSRELALDVIRKLKLNELAEFDPLVAGISPLKYALITMGVSRNPMKMTAEERVLESYYDRLTAFPVERSRVMTIEFVSNDPNLAARVTNAIADGYLEMQQSAKQQQNKGAAQWLQGQIDQLRPRVEEAEAKAAAFRGKSNLFLGTNNTTLSGQQLGELNSAVGVARAQKADAETRARLIRDMIRRGDPIEASDVINSDLIKRLSEQRITLRGQLAEQSSTLLDGHPRIKELRAQIGDLDKQITGEAEKLVRSLENDAKIAGARADALSGNLDQLKRQAVTTDEQDVQLRALEREAKAQRELLESYLAKFREATTRETIGAAPPDTRIISRAVVSNTPYFPKKLPTILVAMLATLVIGAGFVTTGELMRHSPAGGGAPVPVPVPVAAYGLAPTRPNAAPTHPALGVAFSAIDDLARSLRAAGEGGRRLAVFGVSRSVGTTLTAVTLARALGRDARVVVIDLAVGSPGIAAISTDPQAPGVAEVVRGTASFGDVITRDKLSRVHLIATGQVGGDAAALPSSPRLAMMVEALARTYDHVIIDAGTTFEAPVDRLHRLAPRAVLVSTEETGAPTMAARDRLTAAGYGEIVVLDGAVSAAAAAAAA
jgi:uncharacterized protein involved in exopolysaccharide biosynthesis/Mrp family chromosome partitioning ATPase